MERSGCPVEKVHVLPSPAPDVSEAYAPPPRAGVPHFLFLGRLVPQKGIQWLLRAVHRVGVEMHLDVAGDGYIEREVKATAEALGLMDRVTFHGWAAPDVVSGLIREARALIVPSLWHEPAGLVTLEAAAYGRAVVASGVGGIPEYALKSFASVVPPNNDEALAEALTRLAGDWDLAAGMGRRGLQEAQTRFSMEGFVQRQEALYALAIDAQADRIPLAT
jgi:glycosyltransferase involved in cell wall biosynthesis